MQEEQEPLQFLSCLWIYLWGLCMWGKGLKSQPKGVVSIFVKIKILFK